MKYSLFILFSSSILLSQVRNSYDSEAAAETVLQQNEETDDVQQRGEELEHLLQHPVNLRSPSYGDLLQIPFISPLLAESIILYTDTVYIEEIDQLHNVALMTPALFERIVPFVTVDAPSTRNTLFWFVPEQVESRSRLEQKLQTTQGFSDQKYLGDARAIYQRIRMESSSLEFAAMTEKDAGELFQDRFTSRYAMVKDLSFVRKVIVGNYNAGSGQGLVLARSGAASKGSDAAGQIKKRGNPITPSVSTTEFRYFDGAAVQLEFSKLNVTGLYSFRYLPASIDSNATVTSFYTSGLYRNQHEKNRRDMVSERMVGGMIQYSLYRDAHLTLSAMKTEYGSSISSSLFHFNEDRSVSAGSIGWEQPVFTVRTFGEVASNDGKSLSSVAGLMIPAGKSVLFSYLHRDYKKGYAAPFARPFGERLDIGEGETGDYVGLELKSKGTSIAAYWDVYELLSTDQSFPVKGKESFFHLTQELSSRSEIVLQIRNTNKVQDDEVDKTSFRVGHTYRISKKFSFAQRYDIVRYQSRQLQSIENGILASFDCIYNNRSSGLSLRSRMTWFQSPSYNSRLYHYEPDVPGNFSNPPLYGTGLRWFILGRIELMNDFSIGMKYSETKKLHAIVIGSGDEQIQGNLDSRITAQIDFLF